MKNASRGYIADMWCRAMHDSPMWPSHGHYQCRTCGREYRVPWELDVTNAPSGRAAPVVIKACNGTAPNFGRRHRHLPTAQTRI